MTASWLRLGTTQSSLYACARVSDENRLRIHIDGYKRDASHCQFSSNKKCGAAAEQ